MNNDPAKNPAGIPGSEQIKTPVSSAYASEPELESMTDMPSLYKKIIPFISSIFVGVMSAGKKSVGFVLEGIINYIEDFYETRMRPQWSEIDYNLRVKFGVSQDVMNDLRETFDRSSWLALPWYIYLYFMSLAGTMYGVVMGVKMSSIQKAQKENPIALPSTEQIVISLIRGEINDSEAADLLGRSGISPLVKAVIIGALTQYPGPEAVATAQARGVITDFEAEDLYTKLSLSPLTVKTIQGLTTQYTSPETIITALIKGELSGDEADDLLDKLNVSVEARKAIVGAIKQIATDEVLMQNVWRGNMSRTEFATELSRRGLDTDQQTYYDNIIERIPPIQDIIHMGVREAFSADKVKDFQYDEDFPAEFGVWATKQGFSEDWAKRYWYAHWQLPSPQMVFEMLHRGLITKAVVDRYLIIADYPKYWRDLLTQISYNPLTRVDVRRMYELGTFDDIPGLTAEQMVLKAYKDIGYSPENAQLMVKFTVDMYGEERKKLTEAKVLGLYKRRLIDRTATKALLKKLKYRNEYIELIIEQVDFDIDQDVLDSLMKKLKSLYLAGHITKSGALAELASQTAAPLDTTALFKSWDYERDAIRKLPIARDVTTWVSSGVITPTAGINKLKQLGYSAEDAKAYIDQIVLGLTGGA